MVFDRRRQNVLPGSKPSLPQVSSRHRTGQGKSELMIPSAPQGDNDTQRQSYEALRTLFLLNDASNPPKKEEKSFISQPGSFKKM